MRARRRVAAAAAILLAPASCEAAPSGAVTVVDSAGVRITLSADEDRTFAVLGSEPVIDLGGADAAGPTQFSNIRGVRVDRHGRLLVADGASNELRTFDPNGVHLGSFGRSGQGPGEFRRIRLLGTFAGDSIALWDDATSRITVLDARDELARTAETWSGDDLQPRAFDVYPDGAVLINEGRILEADAVQVGQILADTVRLARLDPDTRAQTPQGSALGTLWLWTGDNQLNLPFSGATSAFTLRGEEIHLVSGPWPEFRVRVFADGRLTEQYGVRRPARPVTDAELRPVRASFEGVEDLRSRGQLLASLDHPARPTQLPAYAQVVAARDGHVWARIYTVDPWAQATWDVFSTERTWQGQVRTPARFLLHAVEADRVIGVWYDDLDVEHVRVYGLSNTSSNRDIIP
jgi:hypothetical protein